MQKPSRKMTQIYDERLNLHGLSPYGLSVETENEAILGGMMGRHRDTNTPFIALLYAPTMPQRFKAFVVDGEMSYLVRTDDVRCRMLCDPLEAEEAAEFGKILIVECPVNNSINNNISYEIEACLVPGQSMRM